MTDTSRPLRSETQSTSRSPQRVRSIQPDFTDEMLDAGQETVTSHETLNDLRAVIAYWSLQQDGLPDGFADNFYVESAARQVVPAVVVHVQHSKRSLIQNLIPYDNSGLSEQRFNRRDLFALSDVDNRCEFPSSPTTEIEVIPGNESLKTCAECSGAGENLCEKCDGVGTHICRKCSGGGKVECLDCSGQGEIIVGGTETRTCGRCRGRGTTTCLPCSGKGNNDCECDGGTFECDNCAGHGQMRTQWHLETVTRTQTFHQLVCRNEWVDDDHKVAIDSVLLRYYDWAEPERFRVQDSRKLVPDCLSKPAGKIIESLNLTPGEDELATGLRIQIQASYVYHVEVTHDGRVADFFVSGCSNTVTPRKVKRREQSVLSRVTDKYVVSQEESLYARAVSEGEIFLTDRRCLGLELRRLGIPLEVTDEGYCLPADGFGGAEIRIGIGYDRSNQQILRTSIDLVAADRSRFPEYMAASQSLLIGTLGLLERNNRTFERIVLVDSRFYQTVSPAALQGILELMRKEAWRLVESNFELPLMPARKSSRIPNIRKICDYISLNTQAISRQSKVSIERGHNECLLKFYLANGRRQSVLLSLKAAGAWGLIELKSRCRTACDAQTIRSALRRNINNPCGGFALDFTTKPATVDLVQRLIVVNREPNYPALFQSLNFVMHSADAIEQKQSDIDEF